MKNLIKSILTNMIFYSLILTTIFIFSKRLVNDCNMEFTDFFYFIIITIVILLFIIGGIQILCKIKDILIRAFMIVAFLVFIITTLAITHFVYSILVPYQEHVIQKQDKKYVAHIYSYVTTKIEYYEHVNFMLRGKNIVLYEELENYQGDI